MTQIKICGLKTREAVLVAAESGVDYIGFVFAQSKRQVTAEEVLKFAEGIQTPKRVGVFVNEPFDSLLTVGDMACLDVFQLHGAETPEICSRLKRASGKQVWKAWQVRGNEQDLAIREYAGTIDACLLDTFLPGAAGGTGQTFQWNEIERFRSLLPGVQLFVAGGLNSGNVGELLEKYKPDGVDVSSGVETNGVKDIEKMRLFIRKVRERD
ncbi:phosphoribosylanthranilate isomerase [Effusibacillus lacus]|uniref:N-(5'-phosphoribosyl)anthranilate isomerase n=1 Tax=Effusibacillus lacus TaxID=1348429 RepID=A0A292YD35_9BACL|nr:phosphoribosylanthranilate isomerase [Effusibacillus lacus]TCS75306.1 phosphoribosylanthranilate isomerase [Effusibacillus lacus]GAX89742.1 N-(5'-phosphoribosyl)anthranilate isomerase [Effusibacillus lacus]